MSNLIIKIEADAKNVAKEYKKVAKQTKTLSETMSKATKIAAVGFAGFAGAIGLAVKEAAAVEDISTQFEVLTGNTQTAQKAIKDLQKFAAKTPFSFKDIAKAGQQLLGFGFEAGELSDQLRKIGDVSAAVGAPLGDLTLILGQVRAAGKLTGERLLQLQERAVPIGPALAETLGVAEESIKDLVSQGKVSFEDFSKAFASISEEGGLAFDGLGKKSKTFSGLLSTLQDNFQASLAVIGKEFIPVLKLATEFLTKFVAKIRENPELAKFAAKVLGISAALTGAVAILGAAGLAVLKVSAVIAALSAAFLPATVAASGFWVALTGPIGIAVAGIAALAAGVAALFVALKDEKPADSIEEVNKKLEEQKKKLAEVNAFIEERNGKNVAGAREQKKRLEEEIAGLEAVKMREEELGRLRERQASEEQQRARAREEEKKKQAEQVVDPATAKRIQDAKDEREILRAEAEGKEQDEIEFIKRRQEIRNAAAEAEKIKNDEERAIAKENVKLQQDELLLQEQEFFAKQKEQKALQREEQKALDAELRELDKEERAALNEEDLEELRSQVMTEDEVDREFAKKKAQRQIKARNQELKDRKQHGIVIAKLNRFLNQSEVQGAFQAAGQLTQLQNSKSKKQQKIGRIAGLIQIGQQTAIGAISAYTSLAPIPIVGPALGIAAAAALTAFGIEKANELKAFQKGGLATGGIPGVDSIPSLLTPGEIVAPTQNFDEVVESVARARGFERREETGEAAAVAQGNITFNAENILDNEIFVDDMIEKIREKRLFENADIGD